VSRVSCLARRPVGTAFFGQRGIGDSGPGIRKHVADERGLFANSATRPQLGFETRRIKPTGVAFEQADLI